MDASTLVLEVDGPAGRSARTLVAGTLSLGRGPRCDVRLEHESVSKRHLVLEVAADGVRVTDVGSRNGTWRLEAGQGARRLAPGRPAPFLPGDALQLGPFRLGLRAAPAGARAARAAPWEGSPEWTVLVRRAHDALVEALAPAQGRVAAPDDAELARRARGIVAGLASDLASRGLLPEGAEAAHLERAVLDEALGFGPLEPLLADSSISEIMVNGARRLWVEREGRLEPAGRAFSSDRAVLAVLERMVGRVGRRIDESSPLVDARLPDGSRLNAVIPPLALCGPCVTIRKFRREVLSLDDLVRAGTLAAPMARFLSACVRLRRNVVISGGTGSGKTTTLNALAACIPASERIVTVEDAAELRLRQAHWVPLESRPPNLEGRGAVTIRDLVRNALRMRPDRILVGECRGGEALDMLQAMNTGHDGSLTTLHANSPRDALSRLETMVLMSGLDLPMRAIREQVASAVQLLVHQSRLPDGRRRITHVVEVVGLEGDVFSLGEIYRYRPAADRFEAGGYVPQFWQALRARGLDPDPSLFPEPGRPV